jgi:hypothetical protein
VGYAPGVHDLLESLRHVRVGERESLGGALAEQVGEDAAPRTHACTTLPVVRGCGRHTSHRRPVPCERALRHLGLPVRGEVERGLELTLEVRVIHIHAVVVDRDDHLRVAHRHVPRLGHASIHARRRALLPGVLQVPLIAKERVVRRMPLHVATPLVELGVHPLEGRQRRKRVQRAPRVGPLEHRQRGVGPVPQARAKLARMAQAEACGDLHRGLPRGGVVGHEHQVATGCADPSDPVHERRQHASRPPQRVERGMRRRAVESNDIDLAVMYELRTRRKGCRLAPRGLDHEQIGREAVSARRDVAGRELGQSRIGSTGAVPLAGIAGPRVGEPPPALLHSRTILLRAAALEGDRAL